MKECSICKRVFDDGVERCTKDRSPLKVSLPGTVTLNNIYVLEQRIGQGSLGLTYRATRINDSASVVIKTISAELIQTAPKAVDLFFKEAEIARNFSHINLVQVYDYGQSPSGYLYLVMEDLVGLSLSSLLEQEGPLEIDRAIDLTNQIGEALSYIHMRGYTHQDLKPSNIFIVYDDKGKEQIKVLDFGIGQIKWKEIGTAFPGAKETLFGLPYYQSPEQFTHNNISATSEVYSLGIILYQMLTGKLPFFATTYAELVQQHLHQSPASLWTMRTDIAEDIDTFVLLALSKQQESRIQSISAFLSCLKLAANNKTVRSKPVFEEDFNLETLATSMTLLNMPVISSKTAYIPDPEDYVPSNSQGVKSLAVEETIASVTKVMEISQLPNVFGRQRVMVTVGIMLGLLLAALEVTVVATAMPKVVATLGGFSTYSWVFSIYLLTSTVGMPIWGKLSDLYGRRICYQIGIVIFILGSILCGFSQSMNQLILFRAVQGFGGGALIPLALTVIGDMYALQERAKMQAVISGVWGFSSITGPLIGGFLTDYSSWRGIFFINLPLGLIALGIISWYMREPRNQNTQPKIDYLGAMLLTVSISSLLLACLATGDKLPGWLGGVALVVALLGLAAFIYVERKVPEPIMPLWLFREKIFVATVLGNLLCGCVLFGSMPFLTLFAQGVLNSSATKAGTVLMPLILGWVVLSAIGAKFMLRFGFRKPIIGGMIGVSLGFGLMTLIAINSSQLHLYFSITIVGMGMGLALTALIIAVQSSVPRNQLGIVTSSAIFFRNIGGSIGATVMGALLSASMDRSLVTIAKSITSTHTEQLSRLASNINLALDPQTRPNIESVVLEYFRAVLANGIKTVFIFCFIMGLCAFASSLLVPGEKKQKTANV